MHVLFNKVTRVVCNVSLGETPDLKYHPEWDTVEHEGDLPCPMLNDNVVDEYGKVVARVLDFPEQKRRKMLLATQYHGRSEHDGERFTFNGAVFQIDQQSRLAIDAFGARASNSVVDPARFPWSEDEYWIAADNTRVYMTAEEAYAFFSAVGIYISACAKHKRTIKDAIAAAQTQEELDQIDVTAGYPPAVA